jgi:AAA+ ATPase superfamily predicted ATPase
VAEPDLLLFDEVREPRVYRTILQAIGGGAHTLDEISNAALVGKAHLSAYLTRLQELRLVERRLPVTVPPGKRAGSRLGRYHLADPFLRFFFRFIAPRQDEIGYQPERVLPDIQAQLRAFVATAFESLCREWVSRASQAGQLPFAAQYIGAHWKRGVQVDIVGVNGHDKAILLGECKWGADAVPREVVTELVEDKAPRVLKVLPEEGRGWSAHYALFARAGFTAAARVLAQTHGAVLVDLKQLDRDLE